MDNELKYQYCRNRLSGEQNEYSAENQCLSEKQNSNFLSGNPIIKFTPFTGNLWWLDQKVISTCTNEMKDFISRY